MGLKTKIFLRAGGLLALVVVAICVCQSMLMLRYHREDDQRLFMSEAALLGARISEAVRWDDRAAAKAELAAMVAEHAEIEYAFIQRRGRPYVHTFPNGVPKALLGPIAVAPEGLVRAFENAQGEVSYDITAGIEGMQAQVHLGISQSQIDSQLSGLLATVAGMGVGAIILGAFLAGAIAAFTAREVNRKSADLLASETRFRGLAETLRGALDEVTGLVNRAKDSPPGQRVRFDRPTKVTCWELTNCSHRDCPCFGQRNLPCWQFAGTPCKGEAEGDCGPEIDACQKCEVFQAAAADPIYEIGEAFNGMMTILDERQAALLQSEKTSMLGRLAAGVAHDINTPTGAILNVTVDAYEHLRGMMAMVVGDDLPAQTRAWLGETLGQVIENRTVVSESAMRSQRREVEQRLREGGADDARRKAEIIVTCGISEQQEQAALTHLSQESVLLLLEHAVAFTTSVEISIDSAKKIARIVRALRYYSREGQDELLDLDVAESIENTLVILQNRIKHIARVEMSFAEDLPPVRSGPELSQIWTNILNNACDAIEESGHEGMGLIEITAGLVDNERVVVEISNEGPPIGEDVLQKVFDPFFTTKPMGKGTGLGLSICTGILGRWGGAIAVRNDPGRVTFIVSLPASPSEQEQQTRRGGDPVAEIAGLKG